MPARLGADAKCEVKNAKLRNPVGWKILNFGLLRWALGFEFCIFAIYPVPAAAPWSAGVTPWLSARRGSARGTTP